MIGQYVSDEMVSETLNSEIGDVFGVPEEVFGDVFIFHVEVDLHSDDRTSTNTRLGLGVAVVSYFSLKPSPTVMT